MLPVHEMEFGTRRWVFYLTSLAGACAAMGIAALEVMRHATLVANADVPRVALAVVAVVVLVSGVAMWLPWRLWRRATLRRFDAAMRVDDRVEAESAIEALARIEAPTDKAFGAVWIMQFHVWCAMEDWAAARASFGQADLEKLGEKADPLLAAFAALAWMGTGETDRALALIEPIAKRFGDQGRPGATAHAAHGMVLQRIGRHGEAIEHLERAVRGKPIILGRQTLFTLGDALLAEGRHQEARVVFAPFAEKSANTILGRRAVERLAQCSSAYR